MTEKNPEKDDEQGQVSEVGGLGGAGEVSDGDAVAGQPGGGDEGPTGPDATTFDDEQARHRDKDEVDPTG